VGLLESASPTGSNVDRGKVAYNWISPNPAKVGPTLGGVVIAVVVHLRQKVPAKLHGRQCTFCMTVLLPIFTVKATVGLLVRGLFAGFFREPIRVNS